ncbi:SRPBCC family protein [Actinokineospora sp. HUAS TT18]|uniref:SRPBCC family protein n=1 Tax=Actinokineospora sp. HUAS TT18 TaxID=3447451 RepID=UPI003F51EBF1
MSAKTKNETRIEADPALPTITITREFDAPRDRVYRAWVDPNLVKQWLGPRDIEMRIEEWDARTGGCYRYTAWRDGEEVAAFYGSFHEARENERLVQTFTYRGMPDGVSLETMTFTDLGDGRTRVTSLAVVDTMEAREAMLASGMDAGVIQGYEQLDELLAKG